MNWKFLLKLSISALLLFFILRAVDFGKLAIMFVDLNLIYLILAIITVYMGIFISSLKWKLLLSEQNLKVSFKKTFNAYYSGMFFNSFLPSTVGGDFVKAKLVTKKNKYLAKSLMSTLFERYLGVIALTFLALIGVFKGITKGYPSGIIFMALISFLCVLVITAIFFSRNILHLKNSSFKGTFGKFVFKYYKSLNTYRKFSIVTLKALTLSFVFQILCILYVFFIVLSLNISIPLAYVFLIVPLINLILMIPISINGIGLRESAYVFFFTSIGLSSVSAIATSFLAFCIMTLISAVGGLIFLLNKYQ